MIFSVHYRLVHQEHNTDIAIITRVHAGTLTGPPVALCVPFWHYEHTFTAYKLRFHVQ